MHILVPIQVLELKRAHIRIWEHITALVCAPGSCMKLGSGEEVNLEKRVDKTGKGMLPTGLSFLVYLP